MRPSSSFHDTIRREAMDPAHDRRRLHLVPSPEAAERAPLIDDAAADDRALTAAVRAGDRAAAAAFYKRLRPRLDITIRRLLGRRDADHDDLVQNSLIEIVRSIDAYRGESSLEAWAMTIAARVVYKDVRRRASHRRAFSAEEVEADRQPGVESESRRIITRDLVGRVRKHLADIDQDKAWTFLLHDIHGFDLREVAEITGASVAAAQSRLVRGRRDIHERIEGDAELAGALTDLEEG
jgi:RNA polymerase sigma-70 factor (ECF subfamily)